MHAEMHAIFSLTGMSPSFKTQVQGMERRVSPAVPPEQHTTKGPKGFAGPESTLSGPTSAVAATFESQSESDSEDRIWDWHL